MIEAAVKDRHEIMLCKSVLPGEGDLKFVRFGKRPYNMVEFTPTAAFFIPEISKISWICLGIEEFLETMEDACRKKKGFFDPPV